MATVQDAPRSTPRHESFVEAQLARARGRIRAQDVSTAALGLVVGTLVYALGMILLDRWLQLPSLARQLGLLGYLAAAGAYVAVVLLRPFRREVNPYFAARQVERAVPAAQNSVVSWLDLRDEPLPASIRAAVGQKAAGDLKRVHLDDIIRDRRLPWLGGVAGGLLLAAAILFFLLRPAQFLSLLGRALIPFGSTAIAARTELTLVQPAEGNVTVPINTTVEIKVGVAGRVPDPRATDAVRLRFRYNPADPVAEELPLAATARDPREFAVRLSPNQVRSGFMYQVVGGDAATPEYRVQVRSSPLIEGFEVIYHFRPYLCFRDLTTTQPNLEGQRGTEVKVTARTNRRLREGRLTLLDKAGQPLPNTPALAGEPLPEEPNAVRFRFVLEQDGKYIVTFKTSEGEENNDPKPYDIRVLSDFAPQVDVTRPAAEQLPVNGTLQVEGKASDDFGITKMRLCLQVKDTMDAPQATRLADKPYRPEKSFKFDDGTYPKTLDYLDFLPLDQLKTPLGLAVEPKQGLVIEYWLEAEDNCDYPDPAKPNVGRSKVYRTIVAEPQKPDDQKNEAQAAANDKQKHDKEQDQKHANENEGKKNQQGQQGGQDPNAQQQPQDGNPQNPQQGGDNARDPELERKAQDVQDKLNQHDRDKQKGQGKDEGQPPPPDATQSSEPKGEPKGGGNPQAGNPQPQPGEPKGDPKSQPQPGGDPSKGEGKNEGQQQQPPEPGEAKAQQPQGNANDGARQPGDNGNRSGTPPPGGNDHQGPQSPRQQSPTSEPSEAKPQPQNQSGQNDPGEPKSPPQPGDQPGTQKPAENPNAGGSNQGTGERGNNAGTDPQTGNQTPQRGNSDNQPPNQKGSDRGKAGSTRPQQSGDKAKDDKSKNDTKTEPGRGQQAGDRGSTGQQTGQGGPQKDPNQKNPNANPDSQNADRDSANRGNTPSGRGGRGNPPPKPEQNQSGQGQEGQQQQQPGQAKDRGTASDKGDAKTGGDDDPNDPGHEAPGAVKNDAPPKSELKDAQKPGQPGGPPQADPRTAGTQSGTQPQGDAKPDKAPAGNDQARGGQQGDGKGQVKPDQKPTDGSGRKPTADEIAKLAEQIRNGDPKTVEQAAKALENMKNQSGDAETRQAIEDALKKMGDGGGQQPGTGDQQARNDQPKSQRGAGAGRGEQPKANTPPQPGQDGAGERQGQAPQRGDPTQAKAGSGRGDPGAKGRPQDQTGQPPQPNQQGSNDPNAQPKAGGNDPPGQPGTAPGQSNVPSRDAGNAGTGAPTATDHNPDSQGAARSPAEFGPAPDANHAGKSGDLQLEKFPKNPDPDLLKDLKMNPDEYKLFRQQLDDYAKRLQAARAADAANLQRAPGQGTSAANSGVRRIESGTTKTGDLNRGPAVPLPSEYRDGYKGFTEDVSKTAGGTPKKDK